MCSWKEEWDTAPDRIILSRSSLSVHMSRRSEDGTDTLVTSGATMALCVGAVAAQNGEPAFGLIISVTLINTHPDFAEPMGRE